MSDESFAGGTHAALAVGGQQDVCAASVAAVERPFSLAVADDEDAGDRRRHRPFFPLPGLCCGYGCEV